MGAADGTLPRVACDSAASARVLVRGAEIKVSRAEAFFARCIGSVTERVIIFVAEQDQGSVDARDDARCCP